MALEMKAEVEGRKARKSGIALINNPYPDKSAEAKLWVKGWKEGEPHPSFQNGCARAEKEIQNKLQNAGMKVENAEPFPVGTKVKVALGEGIISKIFEDRDIYDIPGRYLVKGKTPQGGPFEIDYPRNGITRV